MFAQHQLPDFEAIWARDIDWFEPPNERRGGWSGVGTIALQANHHAEIGFFVKKQQNHGRKTWRNPVQGEPTFRREFQRLQFLEAHNFAAPKVVFYAESIVHGNMRAILITEALTDFLPLDEVTKQLFLNKNVTAHHQLIQAVSVAIKRFHTLGLVHRALYPKHIFVKNAESAPEIALIDLEKARFSPFFWWRTYFDLAALHRHSKYWRYSQRMYFFLQYCQVKHLNFFGKWLCCRLIKRAIRD